MWLLKTFFLIAVFVTSLFIAALWLHKYNKKSKNTNTIVIGLAGDVMLGRMVNEWLQKVPPTYVWGTMLPALQKNDLNIVNLECAITAYQEAVPKVFNFKTDPKNVAVLKQGNIHMVSLANNHIRDFGDTGLEDTLSILKKNNIAFAGAGMNIDQAQQAAMVKKHGINIGMIAFTDNEPDWIATKTTPGINYITIGDHATAQAVIKRARPHVDILIASLHWGPNMRERPTQAFIDFAHFLIDEGVDIIHGHSAHIFQAIELYKNKLILYDTGDFVDDYMVTPALRNDLSFLFLVHATKNGLEKLELIPMHIDMMQVNKASAADATWALERIKALSQERGTVLNDDGSLIVPKQ